MATFCLQPAALRATAFTGTQLATPSRATLRTPVNTTIQAAQTLQGTVVSTKGQKTAVVAVNTFQPHPLYKKAIRTTNKFVAHDETNKCTVGDVVLLEPCRPLSKRKRFTVGDIVKKADN